MRKSDDIVAPRLRAVALGVCGVVYPAVVVDDDLAQLRVAFAWQQDVGTGIFEHGHQIRQHETLREEILDRLP